ncbi:MAG: endonuclease [Synergistaceae bacterium]|nr:endonuclease [Synergistaceae bacterium]
MILAFDPGRDKTGFAFVDEESNLILSGIFESREREKFFDALTHNQNRNLSAYILEGRIKSLPENLISHVKFIAIGNGTHSKEFHEYIKNRIKIEIMTVDERNTTLEARSLYWKIHEPKFFMRLLPESMRVPSRVLDDLAAWAIAIRAVKRYRDIKENRL